MIGPAAAERLGAAVVVDAGAAAAGTAADGDDELEPPQPENATAAAVTTKAGTSLEYELMASSPSDRCISYYAATGPGGWLSARRHPH